MALREGCQQGDQEGMPTQLLLPRRAGAWAASQHNDPSLCLHLAAGLLSEGCFGIAASVPLREGRDGDSGSCQQPAAAQQSSRLCCKGLEAQWKEKNSHLQTTLRLILRALSSAPPKRPHSERPEIDASGRMGISVRNTAKRFLPAQHAHEELSRFARQSAPPCPMAVAVLVHHIAQIGASVVQDRVRWAGCTDAHRRACALAKKMYWAAAGFADRTWKHLVMQLEL